VPSGGCGPGRTVRRGQPALPRPGASVFGPASSGSVGNGHSSSSATRPVTQPASAGDTGVQVGKVPGSRMLRSTSAIFVRPQKAIVRSSSLWMISSILVTPAWPMAPRP